MIQAAGLSGADLGAYCRERGLFPKQLACWHPLPPGQIVAILAEEQQYVGSEMTIYRIMREEGLLNHRA